MIRDQNAALKETLDALKSLGRRGRDWMLEHYDTRLSAQENIAVARKALTEISTTVDKTC